MDSKWIQNGFKMDSKWIQNVFKMYSKCLNPRKSDFLPKERISAFPTETKHTLTIPILNIII